MRHLALPLLLLLAACEPDTPVDPTPADGTAAAETEAPAVALPTSRVTVAYEGTLADGTVFDSSPEATFSLRQVIPGFQSGIAGMTVGEEKTLVIPPDEGYGAAPPPGSGISPTDTLTFEVTLLRVH